jgi:biofilm protein TabA
MIVDHIENASRYYGVNGEFKAVFEKMKECLLAPCEDTNYIVSEQSTISLQNDLKLRNRKCSFEYHKKFIDVHLCMKNKEIIEYSGKIGSILESFEEKDFFLAQGRYAGEVVLTEGMFAVFFTGELHKPLIGDDGKITAKCVAKIKCEK